MNHQLLKGKRGIIFGALDERSLAWKTAERAFEEGAQFVLTNAPVALRLGTINQLADKCKAKVIPADATLIEDIEKLYDESIQFLGGKIDFLLHSIGMSPNVRKGKTYNDLDYNFFLKTLDISGLSLHKILQVAEKKDVFNEGASVVALTYVAAQRVFPHYSDMSQAKALLESIARSYGYQLGVKKKVRINTVSQSPTVTTAGSGVTGFDTFYSYADKMSPLGNASALDCADYLITLFSDLTRKVTMQNLFNDGGFSSMGISQQILEIVKQKN
ncbi:MAG: enoyl-ACP reductase [Bacteroidetes bacterium RIFCSPLOWO2_02_FULL_36_8]|nr:MAG: enoyl-ACP reductase [Bacteroidetes bacterium RIFCSPLOWO2_02_FULL_36_8]OFY69111.1 MAG: enoyl-ACP reductase [Bacteroidetes bacterium RIFCSPLOWO2_12_FULL_37_12]